MIAGITLGVLALFALALLLWGWWILNHELPTDMWTGKTLEHDDGDALSDRPRKGS